MGTYNEVNIFVRDSRRVLVGILYGQDKCPVMNQHPLRVA